MAIEAIDQMASEAESILLTVIAGLEASIPQLATRRSLEIHFVAAASHEVSARAITEEFLHHLPALRELTIHFVGPEARLPVGMQQSSPNLACEECKSGGATRRWALHTMEYHRFLAANPGRRPDLIVGLNTGFSEVAVASWAPTMDAICALGVPVVFTAYSLPEARMEAGLLRGRGCSFIVDVEENKWRGVIPRVNKGIKYTQGILALYSSFYWYVFRGRQ
ncbi:hypothetical protein FB45DRAFT_929761 [Roridomyces roridus]|uniref:Mitochondrial splicing suppressor 51-like C-terminal domain-containing protein n=1 Tax=Roridomyces roridus TaxID=1738132 RepID=A0AAD7BGY7_9AGAR|nr:hypothetical protein FB45DRAFT_929761 [Roridomyces roridus]